MYLLNVLQVAPVCAISSDEMPPTPTEDETYAGAHPPRGGGGGGGAGAGAKPVATCHELETIFEVIGTPPWSVIEAVPMAEWRHYLKDLPAR